MTAERVSASGRESPSGLDDFRTVLANGRTLWKGRQDKGHRAHATAFRRAVEGGPDLPTEAMRASMRATPQAAEKARAS
jgi:hypothetical protein